MKSPVSVYRLLAVLAVLHGLALFSLATVALQTEWGTRLWIAFATFWFFWPIVLTLHPGQTVWKVVSLTTIVLLILPLFRFYDLSASSVFEWPEGFSLTPWRAVSWTQAYLAGRAGAKSDLKNGHLVVEEYGLGAGGGHRVQILRDRYGIQVKAIAQCVVDSRILGHAAGYNGISRPEIARRYGANVFDAAFDEGRKLDSEEWARRERRAKEIAKSISSLSPDSKVKLESLSLYGDDGIVEGDLPPNEIANVTNLVRWIEALMTSAVPNDAPPFETQITAELSRTARPKLDMSSSPSAAAHMTLYHSFDNVPDIRSRSDRMAIVMHYRGR